MQRPLVRRGIVDDHQERQFDRRAVRRGLSLPLFNKRRGIQNKLQAVLIPAQENVERIHLSEDTTWILVVEKDVGTAYAIRS